MSYTLGELAKQINGTLTGPADSQVNSIASLASAGEGDIAFISGKDYLALLENTDATAVILDASFADKCPVAHIICDNPHLAFTKAAQLLHAHRPVVPSIHDSAVIDNTARVHESACISENVVIGKNVFIAEGCFIAAGCVIQQGVSIGIGSHIDANVTLCENVTIGSNAIIHPGVVIGADGFGLSKDGDTWLKVPQIGSVVIGDDVEIGANTTIDRGALDDTIIGNGVKLDNQIQVAHNVIIGDNTATAGCVGIAGSAHIGAGCTVGGGVGILGHLEIVDDVHITAMSLVTRSIQEPGVYSSGTPLQENREWHRNFVRFRQLDDMAKRLKALEKKLAQLDKG